MKKTRSDAKWLALAPEQIALVEKWLLVEKLSYDDALERAKSEFGFTGSKASLKRFYVRAKDESLLRRLRDSGDEAAQINGAGVSAGSLRDSGMKLLGRQFLQQMKSEAPADATALARLLLQSESNDLHRHANELRRQNQQLRERHLRFDERRWEFDVEEEAKKLVPLLKEVMDRLGPAKKTYKYAKMINRVRMKLFGCCPDPMPESEKEEAEIAAAQEAEDRADERARALWVDGQDPDQSPPESA